MSQCPSFFEVGSTQALKEWLKYRSNIIAGPSYKELHARPSMMITTMCHNISDQKFLLVLLSDFESEKLIRSEEKESQIVNMSLDQLA
jgi:hypothetical protein